MGPFMRAYPMFVSLEGRTCLVIGAGRVGRRKIATLAGFGAGSIRVLDTAPMPEELSKTSVRYERRAFAEADLDGAFLVFCCTSDRALNERIGTLCRERGILCNVADAPELSSFTVPATVCQGELTLAISTGGHSPALSKRLRQELEEHFGERYGRFLTLMGRVRALVLALGRETEQNSEVFRALVESRLLDALEQRDETLARAELRRTLPQDLHGTITEILDGLV